jgi:hypothetical protein
VRPSTNANPFATKLRPTHSHTVKAIHFERKVHPALAPVSCSCGWTGVVGQWSEHAPRLSVSFASKEADFAGPSHSIPDTRSWV